MNESGSYIRARWLVAIHGKNEYSTVELEISHKSHNEWKGSIRYFPLLFMDAIIDSAENQVSVGLAIYIYRGFKSSSLFNLVLRVL